jgi:hypothetical protein
MAKSRVFVVGEVYVEQFTEAPYIFVKATPNSDNTSYKLQFLQEKGNGVQTHVVLSAECGVLTRNAFGDIMKLEVHFGHIISKFVPIGRAREEDPQFCWHDWVETPGFTAVYVDCRKCGQKKEDYTGK